MHSSRRQRSHRRTRLSVLAYTLRTVGLARLRFLQLRYLPQEVGVRLLGLVAPYARPSIVDRPLVRTPLRGRCWGRFDRLAEMMRSPDSIQWRATPAALVTRAGRLVLEVEGRDIIQPQIGEFGMSQPTRQAGLPLLGAKDYAPGESGVEQWPGRRSVDGTGGSSASPAPTRSRTSQGLLATVAVSLGGFAT